MNLLSRENLAEVLIALGRAELLLGPAPHDTATQVISELTTVRELVGEILPGGFYALCESCELPVGCEEDHATGDEDGVTICGDCLRKYERAA